MSRTEILAALREMSPADRLAIAEAALQMLREDLQKQTPTIDEDQQMRDAAASLLDDYLQDRELTSFIALDSEDFHAAG